MLTGPHAHAILHYSAHICNAILHGVSVHPTIQVFLTGSYTFRRPAVRTRPWRTLSLAQSCQAGFPASPYLKSSLLMSQERKTADASCAIPVQWRGV